MHRHFVENCTEVCPLKINIHGMLHYNRTLAVKKHDTQFVENTSWKVWKLAMTHRSMIDIAGVGIKNQIVNSIFKNSWGKRRDDLHFHKTFKQLWNER